MPNARTLTALPYRLRGGRGSDQPIILFRDHFFDLRRQVQSRREVHLVAGLPVAQDLGHQYGLEAGEDDSHS